MVHLMMNRTAAVTCMGTLTFCQGSHIYPPPPTTLGEGSHIYDCCRKSSTCTEHMEENNTETCDVHNDTVFLLVPNYITVKLLWCIQHRNPCFNRSHTLCMSLLNAEL